MSTEFTAFSAEPVHPQNPTQDSTNKTSSQPAGIMDKLVGPISNDYCIYFYVFSVLSAFMFFAFLAGSFYTGYVKKMGVGFYFMSIIYGAQFLLVYLQNRILYNMCKNSI